MNNVLNWWKNVEYVHYEIYSPVCCLEYKRAKQLPCNYLLTIHVLIRQSSVSFPMPLCRPQTHTRHVWVATADRVPEGMSASQGSYGDRSIHRRVWVLSRSSFVESIDNTVSSMRITKASFTEQTLLKWYQAADYNYCHQKRNLWFGFSFEKNSLNN